MDDMVQLAKDLQARLEATPADVAVRRRYAEVLVGLGRRGEALAAYERVVRDLARTDLLGAQAICRVMLGIDPQSKFAKTVAERIATRITKQKDPPPPEPEVDVEGQDLAIEDVPPIPLFSDMPRDALKVLLEKLTLQSVAAGAPVVTEGEAGDAMYVVLQGSLRVTRRAAEGESVVAILGGGSFFGEIALLSDAPRIASVIADDNSLLLVLPRAVLHEVAQSFPSVAEVAERFCRTRLLANLLRANPIFRDLPAATRAEIAARFSTRSAAAGDAIIVEGASEDGLYVILRGSCEASTEGKDGPLHYPRMREGDIFGEIAILSGRTATATVRALAPTVLLWLSSEDVRRLVLNDPDASAAVARLGGERLLRTRLLAGDVPVTPAREYLV